MKKRSKIFKHICVCFFSIIGIYVLIQFILLSCAIVDQAVVIDDYNTIKYNDEFYDSCSYIPENAKEVTSFAARNKGDDIIAIILFPYSCTLYIDSNDTEYIFLDINPNDNDAPSFYYKERQD